MFSQSARLHKGSFPGQIGLQHDFPGCERIVCDTLCLYRLENWACLASTVQCATLTMLLALAVFGTYLVRLQAVPKVLVPLHFRLS